MAATTTAPKIITDEQIEGIINDTQHLGQSILTLAKWIAEDVPNRTACPGAITILLLAGMYSGHSWENFVELDTFAVQMSEKVVNGQEKKLLELAEKMEKLIATKGEEKSDTPVNEQIPLD